MIYGCISAKFGSTETTFGGGKSDAFVTKLNANGNDLLYSTYLGGPSVSGNNSFIEDEEGFGIAVDNSGNAYVTGTTNSPTFPTTPGAFQTTIGGGPCGGTTVNQPCPFDAFVTKLNAAGSGLAYSTYLGGTGDEDVLNVKTSGGIAIDSAGNAYVTGVTNSPNFPTTPGAFRTIFGGGSSDAFVTKLNADGNGLLYSTYLGGNSTEFGDRIAVDRTTGEAYVTGVTNSPNFPTTRGAFQTTFGGGLFDAFIMKLNTNPSVCTPVQGDNINCKESLVYSTYLGGSDDDFGSSIAVDSFGNAYVTGATSSLNFTTRNPLQPDYHGGFDAFIVKIADNPDLTLTKSHTGNFVIGANGDYLLEVTNIGVGNTTGPITVDDMLPGNLTLVQSNGLGWICTGSTNVICTHEGPLAAGASLPGGPNQKDRFQFYVTAAASPIGTVESFGAVMIGGRVVHGKGVLWGGELLQAHAEMSARVLLDSVGQVTLKGGAVARLATAVDGFQPKTNHRVLIVSLLSGEIVVKLQPGADAYIESGGSTFTASGGASFRLGLLEGQAVIEAVSGEIRAEAPVPQPEYEISRVDFYRPLGNYVNLGDTPIEVKRQARKRTLFRVVRRTGGRNPQKISFALGDEAIEDTVGQDVEPAPNILLQFELTSPGIGIVNPPTVTTNPQGIAEVELLAGPRPLNGKLKATATIGGQVYSREWDVIVLGGFLTTRNKLLLSALAAGTAASIVVIKTRGKNPIKPLPPPITIP